MVLTINSCKMVTMNKFRLSSADKKKHKRFTNCSQERPFYSAVKLQFTSYNTSFCHLGASLFAKMICLMKMNLLRPTRRSSAKSPTCVWTAHSLLHNKATRSTSMCSLSTSSIRSTTSFCCPQDLTNLALPRPLIFLRSLTTQRRVTSQIVKEKSTRLPASKPKAL